MCDRYINPDGMIFAHAKDALNAFSKACPLVKIAKDQKEGARKWGMWCYCLGVEKEKRRGTLETKKEKKSEG